MLQTHQQVEDSFDILDALIQTATPMFLGIASAKNTPHEYAQYANQLLADANEALACLRRSHTTVILPAEALINIRNSKLAQAA